MLYSGAVTFQHPDLATVGETLGNMIRLALPADRLYAPPDSQAFLLQLRMRMAGPNRGKAVSE